MKKRCLAIMLAMLMVMLSLPIGPVSEVHAADYLDAPANFTATQWGYALYLNWEPVEGAADYVIEEIVGGQVKSTIHDSDTLDFDGYGWLYGYIPEEDRNTNVDCQVITSIDKNKMGGGPYNNTYRVHAVDADGAQISWMKTVSGTYETGISFNGRVTVAAADTYYTGEPVTTTFTATDLGGIAVTAEDYTVSYEDNIEIGTNTAKATLSGKKGTRFYDSKTVTFSILEQTAMTYDAIKGGFLLENATDLQRFANIVAGISKRNQGYRTVDTTGEAYEGDIDIKGILQNDIAIDTTIRLTGNSDAVPGVIDLDGHTITASANYAFYVSGVDLSIISGTETKGKIQKTAGDAYVLEEYAGSQVDFQNIILDAGTSGYSGSSLVWLHGGDVTFDNCEVMNKYGEGVYSDDGSSITVENGSKIDTYHASFFLYSSDLTIKDSEVKSANNRCVYSDPNERKAANTVTIDHSKLIGYYRMDDSIVVATSDVDSALYLYPRTSLVVMNHSEIEGFNTGICTYGSIDIQDSWINAKRGILTKDEAEGTPTQKYPEYSVGVLYAGDRSKDVSISNSHIQANTTMIGHIRGFAILSCPDGIRGDLLKLNKSGAIPAKNFLADGQQFYAKNVADIDTYVNGEVYINDGTAPEDTLHGYVEYVLNGATNAGSNKDEYELNENDGYLEIADPTYDGAQFEGWYFDEDFSDPVIEQAEPLNRASLNKASSGRAAEAARITTNYAEYTTLYAKWKLNQYKIIYNLNGGTNNSKNPSSYTVERETITLGNPTRTGYSFNGWYKESSYKTKVTTIPKGSRGDVTLYAKWTPVKYTIAYNLNGGTNSTKNPSSFTVASETITLGNPTRTGYSFDGWYKDSGYKTKVTSIPKGSIGNITLYAKWTLVKYTIAYNLNGGTNSTKNPASYTVTSETITLSNSTRTGYSFNGWYKESDYKTKVTNISKGSTGNVTLYAKWTPVTYTITYNLNSGKNSSKNPSSYTVVSETITLTKPTRTGYTFGGWYKDSKFKNKVTSIPKGSTGNVSLHAKWTANKYTVKFDANGGKGSMKAQTFTYDKGTKLTKNKFTKSKKKFKGWATSKSNAKNGKVKYKNEVSVKNLTTKSGGTVTLYAVWK